MTKKLRLSVFSLLVLFAGLFCTVATATAQIQRQDASGTTLAQPQTEASIKAMYAANSNYLIDITASPAEIQAKQSQLATQAAKGDAFGPGDVPVFLLKVNQEFFRRGDTLKISLIPMYTDRNHPSSISIMELNPNAITGEYNGDPPASFFPAETGDYGNIRGFGVFEEIPIYTRLFGAKDNLGRHTYSIVTYKNNGTLEQQIIFDVYLVNTGTYGRNFYVKKTVPIDTGLIMHGRFPANTPIFWYLGVKDAGASMTGPNPQYAAYSNGTKLVLDAHMSFTRVTSVDALMWGPYVRYAFFGHNARIDDQLF